MYDIILESYLIALETKNVEEKDYNKYVVKKYEFTYPCSILEDSDKITMKKLADMVFKDVKAILNKLKSNSKLKDEINKKLSKEGKTIKDLYKYIKPTLSKSTDKKFTIKIADTDNDNYKLLINKLEVIVYHIINYKYKKIINGHLNILEYGMGDNNTLEYSRDLKKK
jgi:hypothetical protein